MSEGKKPVGRPRIFSSSEEFDTLVNKYIESCQNIENPKAITLTGMVLALGFSTKDTLYEYEKYPEFSDSVKRARLLVEQEYENRLIVGTNAAAPIFALKNFGWKDKQEVTVANPQGEVFNTVTMTAEEAYKLMLAKDAK